MEIDTLTTLNDQSSQELRGAVAAITAGSLKKLKLQPGDRVTVIIKATEVLIGK